MCIPSGWQRMTQMEVVEQVEKADPQTLNQQCMQPPVQVRPKLLSLVVTGAHALAKDSFWAVKDTIESVKVRAVTSPDDASGWSEVNWDGASNVEVGKRDATVARSDVKNFTVRAQLDGVTLTVTIEIYDLVSLGCALPDKPGPQTWKAYASDQITRLTAVTEPNEAKVWKLLTWSEGTPTGENNACDAALKPVGDRDVVVKLDDKPLAATLHICQWPTLKIQKVVFTAEKLLNDGQGSIGQVFDNTWVRGRKAHAAKEVATNCQSPVCFVRNRKVKLEATFEVVDKATHDETVKVEADLGFGKVTGNVDVKAGAATATLAITESDKPLPDTVDAQPAWTITWRSIAVDKTSWLPADTSAHPLYVLLGAPTADIYYTLLDISCTAAKGKDTEDGFVVESFKPFAAAKGNGKGFARKGDGVKMSYYNMGSKTATGPAVQTTAGMLGSADGTGRCGGWATLLLHMWAMHGVSSAKKRWYIRSADAAVLNFGLRFLVKNCSFSASGTLATGPYTHKGDQTRLAKEVEKKDGIAGHGQDNPQFDFGDHVVVKHKGLLYDPSYGVSGYTSDELYLAAALDGLGRWPRDDFTFSGVEQHIPEECVPYADGFATYTIVLNPFDWIARSMGEDPAVLFPFCDFWDTTNTQVTLTLRSEVKAGFLVRIRFSTGPRYERAGPILTLADIAAIHATTEDTLFNHAKNAAIKSLRVTKNKLETGDTINVARDVDPNAWRVRGFDL
jgi:hypothetical protein